MNDSELSTEHIPLIVTEAFYSKLTLLVISEVQ